MNVLKGNMQFKAAGSYLYMSTVSQTTMNSIYLGYYNTKQVATRKQMTHLAAKAFKLTLAEALILVRKFAPKQELPPLVIALAQCLNWSDKRMLEMGFLYS